MLVIRRVVDDPTCIIEGEWPKFNVKFFGPVQVGMLHHGSGLLCDVSNGTFGDSILVMGSYTGESNFLILRCDGVHELFRLEHTIVSMVGSYFDAARFCETLKGAFGDDGVCRTKGYLMEALY